MVNLYRSLDSKTYNDNVRAGFILNRPQSGHWLLDHFCILPQYQGKSIGATVLLDVFNIDYLRRPLAR